EVSKDFRFQYSPSRCWLSTGELLVCHAQTDEGQFVGMWNRKGRRLLEHSGRGAVVSPDGRRALIDDYGITMGHVLYDLEKNRELRKPEEGMYEGTHMSADGSHVGWDGIGVIDSATNTVLFEATLFS